MAGSCTEVVNCAGYWVMLNLWLSDLRGSETCSKLASFLGISLTFFLHYADLNKRNLNVKERIKMLITSHLNNSKRCISSDLQIGFAMH